MAWHLDMARIIEAVQSAPSIFGLRPWDVVAAGENEIQAMNFDVIDKPAWRAEARKAAVVAARRKAQLYADAAGVPRRNLIVDVDALRLM